MFDSFLDNTRFYMKHTNVLGACREHDVFSVTVCTCLFEHVGNMRVRWQHIGMCLEHRTNPVNNKNNPILFLDMFRRNPRKPATMSEAPRISIIKGCRYYLCTGIVATCTHEWMVLHGLCIRGNFLSPLYVCVVSYMFLHFSYLSTLKC